MSRVDHAEVLARLKGELVSPDESGRTRQGIGVDKLLALIGRLEAQCTYDEGHLERTLRRYGVVFADDLTDRGAQSAPPEGHGPKADDQEPAPSSSGQPAAPKEDTCLDLPPQPHQLAEAAPPPARTPSLAAA